MVRVRRNGAIPRLPEEPVRSPQGSARYKEGKHAFPQQHPRGALREAKKVHWSHKDKYYRKSAELVCFG